MAAAAQALFAAYARALPADRAFFAEAWETRFVRWLLQSAGPQAATTLPARLQQVAQDSGDAPWAARTGALLRSMAGSAGRA